MSAAGRTVGVPAARLERWVEGFGRRHCGYEITSGATGLTLLGGDGERAELQLPYQPWAGGGLPEALEHLDATRRTLVLVVRRGGYACAVVERAKAGSAAGDLAPGLCVSAAKVGRRHVQGRTAAGGWSQQRFARRRTKQADELADAVAAVAQRLLVPEVARRGAPLWLATGGDRPLVDQVLGEAGCAPLCELPHAVHLGVGDPDRAFVDALPDLLTSATITLYPAP